jgi:hypothetical protein
VDFLADGLADCLRKSQAALWRVTQVVLDMHQAAQFILWQVGQ